MQFPEGRPSSRAHTLAPEGSCKAFIKPARKFDMAETKMAETKNVRRKWRAGLRIILATLVATLFSLLFAQRPARAAEQPGAECLACHGDKSMSTTRAGKTVWFFWGGKKFRRSGPGRLGGKGCPRRPGRKGFSAREACAGKVRHVPLDRAGATCPLAPRQGGCARRSAGAPLCELSRKPRHRSGEGPAVGGGANESALHLRPVPSRRNSGFAQSRDCPEQYFGKLLREHPRGGLAEEGTVSGPDLSHLPQRALDIAAYRSRFLDQSPQHCRHLHQMPLAN